MAMRHEPRGRIGMLVGHGARLALVVAIAWMVHATYERRVSRAQAFDLATVALDMIQRYLPEAATIGEASFSVGGGLDLLDAAGDRVGTILRTSPAGDSCIGFSGPTDLLIVCDANLRVAGVEILSSRDTRDHVSAIARDPAFLQSLAGRTLSDLATQRPDGIDAVAGSTLTSMAIIDSIVLRLGGSAAARFTKEPTLDDVRLIFPTASAFEPEIGNPSVLHIRTDDGGHAGWCLRTSPVADRVIGYQGPTDALIGFDAEDRIVGIAVLASFDNEPYVGYVRDDEAFRGLWRGMPIAELSGLDPAAHGVEGVSGATMTSQAVAEGIIRAAHDWQYVPRPNRSPAAAIFKWFGGIEPPQWIAIAIMLTGLAVAFTRARGTWIGKYALPGAVFFYLGFGAGALVSLAQLLGWAQAGIPTGAAVLSVLTLIAIAMPATARRNVYCSHLCAHGAAQQLILRVAKPKGHVPQNLRPWLTALPWTLLTLAILSVVIPLPIAVVDLEPFDAYLPLIAGIPALVIFAVSLLANIRYPMAYCRYGCPTGALLDHLRLNRKSGVFTWRDGVLIACLTAATLAYLAA
jgi:Na+-translocating ferredoxin:NAD+ oxidoreductase RnfG subunit